MLIFLFLLVGDPRGVKTCGGYGDSFLQVTAFISILCKKELRNERAIFYNKLNKNIENLK